MFSPDDRDRVRDHIFHLASKDERVVGGAVLGSMAHGNGDEWSDLDLMFAVAEDVPVAEVLEGWSEVIAADLGAVALFDLPSGSVIYRVFLLPDFLELDLSFTAASQFGPEGATFEVVFGHAAEQAAEPPTAAAELFGYAFTTCFTHGSPSSAATIGRRNTGSARSAIRRFTWLVIDAGSTAGTAGTSTDSPPTSWRPWATGSSIR